MVERLVFENEEDILARGLEKWKRQEVCPTAIELGTKFIHLIQSAYLPKVTVKWINDSVGNGLFTDEVIDKDTYVGEYTGIVRKNDRRYFEPLNNYCYEYPVLDDLGRSHVIDATNGNLTRFINHSAQPNLRPVHVFYEGFYHLIFIALHRIEKGGQLTYDYGPSYWYIRNPPLTL